MASPSTMRRGSTLIADMFEGYGVTHVFYMEAVLRHSMVEFDKRGIRRVLAHSEKGAAYMADGFARASGRFSVCLAQSVGAANLAAGLQDAYLSHSPVLAITGVKPPSEQHRNTYQELDHLPLFEPVTKYNVGFQNAADFPRIFRQAIREAVSGAPRPVHIEFPQHQGMMVENERVACESLVEKRFIHVPPFRPHPDPADVAEVVRQIYAADRPLFIIGQGAIMSGAGEELLAIIERLGIPFGTTPDGKGIIPENHPLCIGAIGGYGRACANAVAAEADLVIFVGSGVNDQVTNNWTLPSPGAGVIQIDINGSELGRNLPNSASMLADAKMACRAMLASLKAVHPNQAWGHKAGKAIADWRAEMEPLRNASDTPIRTERLCRDVQEALPGNAVLVGDTGFSAIWPATAIELTHPGQRFIRAAGGSLGWGFPASLGVKCALPDRPVVCFVGDGSYWYHLAEMETAVRNGINSVTVLNNNGGLGQCYRGIKMVYEGTENGRPEVQYRFSDVNFTSIAREMGAFAVRVEQPDDIAPALREALACGRPALVEVITDILCDPQDASAIPAVS